MIHKTALKLATGLVICSVGMVVGVHVREAVPAPAAPPANRTNESTAVGSDLDVDSWLTYKGNSQRTAGRNIRLTLPLNLLWRHSSTAPPREYFTSPLVVGPPGQRRIYFAASRAIYCLDAQTGEQIWSSKQLTSPVSAPITLMSSEAGDLILVVTTGGRMSAIRTSDGGQVWEADARATVSRTAPTLANTANGERIILGNATGSLIAFTREGKLDPDWKVRLSRSNSAPASTPALSSDGQRLFVTAEDRRLYAVDLQKGLVNFVVPLSGISSSTPAVLGDQVVVAAGTVVAGFREKNGMAAWSVNTGDQMVASPAGRIDEKGNGTVYIGTTKGNFYAIDTERGRVLWKINLQSDVTGTAVALPGVVLVGTSRGVLFGLKPEDGAIIWQYRLHSERVVTRSSARSSSDSGRRGTTGGNAGGAGRPGGPGTPGVPGGGPGGAPETSAPATSTVTRVYGVSSLPSVVGGQVYLLADNATLYAFDTAPFDAEPPRPLTPSLSVPNAAGGLRSYLMDATPPVRGQAPIYFAVELDDVGSGVDPSSIKVTFNRQGVPASSVVFQASRSVLSVTLVPRGSANLPDGLATVTLNARDYRGNEMTYTGSFTVDNTVSLPPSSRSTPRTEKRGEGR